MPVVPFAIKTKTVQPTISIKYQQYSSKGPYHRIWIDGTVNTRFGDVRVCGRLASLKLTMKLNREHSTTVVKLDSISDGALRKLAMAFARQVTKLED